MDLENLKECLNNGWIEGEPYIFISYASKDKEKVYRFVYELRKLGINVYIDLELQENIAENWLENIKTRLYDIDCKAIISFLSIDYLRSYSCLMEQLMTRSEDLKEEKGKIPKEQSKEKPVEEITSEKNLTQNVTEKKKKISSRTGDITFTLYGKEYTLNQSDMMLTFFAQVLNRHTEVIDSIFQYKGMNCVSELDYTQKYNRENGMPSYFNHCEFFIFPTGESICVGTAYSIGDKLKKMALLLDICGENPEIFSSSQVLLPSVKAVKITEGDMPKGKSSFVKFRIFGESYEQNQSDMLGTVCSTLLRKYPEKLNEAADTLLCIDTKDYRYTAKGDRPVYFSSMNYYEIEGIPCSVGGSFSMKEKLKMIGKLLVICGENADCIEIEGYEIPASALKSSKSKNINYFG